jgi:hypothetical protein
MLYRLIRYQCHVLRRYIKKNRKHGENSEQTISFQHCFFSSCKRKFSVKNPSPIGRDWNLYQEKTRIEYFTEDSKYYLSSNIVSRI